MGLFLNFDDAERQKNSFKNSSKRFFRCAFCMNILTKAILNTKERGFMPERIPFKTSYLCGLTEMFAGAKVLIVGDIMLDAYLFGDAHRISPEAPVPVIRVENEKNLLGGAGNVARNIKSLGADPMLITLTGNDRNADELERLSSDENIRHTFLRLDSRKTTTKTRVLARQQQMLRIDHEECSPMSEKEMSDFLLLLEEHLPFYDVLILSDYGKGLISKDMVNGMAAIQNRHGRAETKILVDPKSPNFDVYGDMYIMTPNTKETGEAAGMPVHSKEDIIRAGKTIMGKYGCRHLLSTLGPDGMALFESPDEIRHIPTMAKSVYDVTGAGDTVMATLALCLAAKLPLLESCLLANSAAGIVVGKVGAATVTREELAKSLSSQSEIHVRSWSRA